VLDEGPRAATRGAAWNVEGVSSGVGSDVHPDKQPTLLDAHTSPHVFLGLDAKTRCYKLGTLFELNISVRRGSVPFRFSKPASAYHHLWSTESRLREGEQNFDVSLSQNPIYSPSTILGSSSKTWDGAGSGGPKIGHIDPDSAPKRSGTTIFSTRSLSLLKSTIKV